MTSFNVSFEFSGSSELQAALSRLTETAPIHGAGVMVEEAESIMANSKDIVPVDWGILKGSGTVLPPEIVDSRAEVVMGYGGAAAHYTIIQHENLEFKHSPGQQAKFLEQPAREAVVGMEGRVAQKLRARFEQELVT